MSEADDLVASGYNAFYAAWGRSPTLRRIWRDHVTGPDYPEEFAHISLLPLEQLRALTEVSTSNPMNCSSTSLAVRAVPASGPRRKHALASSAEICHRSQPATVSAPVSPASTKPRPPGVSGIMARTLASTKARSTGTGSTRAPTA